MGTEATRRFKIAQLMNTIKAAMLAGATIDEEKLIAEASINWGSSRRTILEILNTLEMSNSIIRRDGKVWTPEYYEAELLLKKAEEIQTPSGEKEV